MSLFLLLWKLPLIQFLFSLSLSFFDTIAASGFSLRSMQIVGFSHRTVVFSCTVNIYQFVCNPSHARQTVLK